MVVVGLLCFFPASFFLFIFFFVLIPSVDLVLLVLEFFVSFPVFGLFVIVFLVDLFGLPLSFPTASVGGGLISWIFLCHQEIRHLVSVWQAPQFCFVVVLF